LEFTFEEEIKVNGALTILAHEPCHYFSVLGAHKEAEAVPTDRYVDQTMHFLSGNRALTAVYVASDTQAVVEEFCR
jgi:hypothetical protein